jgi:hypothetical protein
MNGVFISAEYGEASLEPRDWLEDTAEQIRYDRLTDTQNPEQIEWGLWLTNYMTVPT